MDRKNQNEVSCVWRRVSTQSSSCQEFEVSDIKNDSEEKNEVESQAKGVLSCNYPQLSTSQCENQVKVGDDQQISLWSVKTSKEIEVLPGEPTTSTEGHAASVKMTPLNAKHSVSLEVGSSLIRFIKGKGGATQKKVEEEMGVQIIFPSSKKDESIIIEGDCADSVTRASKRIQDIVNEAVKSPSLDYSHSVSLPLAIHPQLVDKLVRFQNSILGISEEDQSKILSMDSDANSSDEELDIQSVDKATEDVELKGKDSNEHVRADVTSIPLVSYAPNRPKDSASEMTTKASELGIERSIFIKPKTFHLTVLMLKLWKEDLVRAAAEVLQNVSSKVIQALESRAVYIQLKGLKCMRGSFAKARVLYAPVEEIGGEGRLIRACQVIIDAFVDAGLVLEKGAKQKLKLHATVMNARHRKRKTRTKMFDFFDARSIVDEYGSEDWGVYLIREAHLSQRFLFDEQGYYHCCTSIPFPEVDALATIRARAYHKRASRTISEGTDQASSEHKDERDSRIGPRVDSEKVQTGPEIEATKVEVEAEPVARCPLPGPRTIGYSFPITADVRQGFVQLAQFAAHYSDLANAFMSQSSIAIGAESAKASFQRRLQESDEKNKALEEKVAALEKALAETKEAVDKEVSWKKRRLEKEHEEKAQQLREETATTAVEKYKKSKEYLDLLNAGETVYSLAYNEALGEVEKAHPKLDLVHLRMDVPSCHDHTEPAT